MTGLRTVGGAVGVLGGAAPALLGPDGQWHTLTAYPPRRNASVNPSLMTNKVGWQIITTSPTLVPAPWDATRGAIQGSGNGSGTFYIFGGYSADAYNIGDTVTCSMWVQLPVGTWWRVNVHSLAGNTYFGGFAPVQPAPADGLPFRVSATYTLGANVAANNLALSILVYPTSTGGALPTSSTVIAGSHMVEKAPALSSYFDGAAPPDADYTYAWTGTAYASASTATP